MREGNIYRPHPKDDGKVLFSVCQSTPGGTGGYPIPIHPHPYRSLSGGGYPIQPWMGGRGYLIQPWMGGGYPDPALDGGVPQPWTGGGTPSPGGYPIPCLGGYPAPPPGIASTCDGYTAGGVPLVFTQGLSCFSLSPGLGRGGGPGYPIPGLDRGDPVPCLDWGGYPIPGPDGGYSILLTGGTPSKIRMGGIPPVQVWMGYPPCPRLDGLPPPPPPQETDHQQSEYLLRGGRYVSCFHAGGVSCSYSNLLTCVALK